MNSKVVVYCYQNSHAGLVDVSSNQSVPEASSQGENLKMRGGPGVEAQHTIMRLNQEMHVVSGLGASGRHGKRRVSAADGVFVHGGDIEHVRKVFKSSGTLTTSQDKTTASPAEDDHEGTGWCGIKVETHL